MKKRILFLMVSAVFAVSCSLDKFPLDRDTVDSYFKDEEQLQNISNTMTTFSTGRSTMTKAIYVSRHRCRLCSGEEI